MSIIPREWTVFVGVWRTLKLDDIRESLSWTYGKKWPMNDNPTCPFPVEARLDRDVR